MSYAIIGFGNIGHALAKRQEKAVSCLQNRSLDRGPRLPSQTVGLGVAALRLIRLAPGVAQQIVAQPDDVLLHNGELVT